MITVSDKLNSLSEKIIERVQSECDERVQEFSKRNSDLLEDERKRLLAESENIIKAARARGESERQHILSRAEMERDHSILKKKNEIFNRTVQDIKKKCEQYTQSPDYLGFLDISIKTSLSAQRSGDIFLEFTNHDIERYGSDIRAIIGKYRTENTEISINATAGDIIGGCLCSNSKRQLRIDNTLRSLIDNNLELIGRMLMESLESR